MTSRTEKISLIGLVAGALLVALTLFITDGSSFFGLNDREKTASQQNAAPKPRPSTGTDAAPADEAPSDPDEFDRMRQNFTTALNATSMSDCTSGITKYRRDLSTKTIGAVELALLPNVPTVPERLSKSYVAWVCQLAHDNQPIDLTEAATDSSTLELRQLLSEATSTTDPFDCIDTLQDFRLKFRAAPAASQIYVMNAAPALDPTQLNSAGFAKVCTQ